VVRRGGTGRNGGDHRRPGQAARKAVLEDEGELRGAVRDVAQLPVEGADALLEGQEAGVNLRAFGPALAVVTLGVGASLASGFWEYKVRYFEQKRNNVRKQMATFIYT